MDMRFLAAIARVAVRGSLTRYQQQEHVRQLWDIRFRKDFTVKSHLMV